MAPKLKDYFDQGVVVSIARELRAAHGAFDETAFVRDSLDGLEALELLGRGWHVADAMHRHLPQPFARAARALIGSLPPEHATTEPGLGSLRYLPHVFFVARYGLDDFEASMHAQYELTKRFTSEYSIRAFLVKYPEATYERLQQWAKDPNVHVRRLVSEGTRPRLPWAPRLRAFQDDPGPVLRLLELLKDDPERYVQRSVANNLNDIGKDHPDVAAEVCRGWSSNAPLGRQWIVKHALRSLLKKGHMGALETLGVGGAPKVNVEQVRLTPARVKVGGELRFSFELESTSKRAQELMVDYAVHFIKANGASRPKVFKLKKLVLPASGRVELRGKISLKEMTTRRHHPGLHHIELLVNGVPRPLATFDLRK